MSQALFSTADLIGRRKIAVLDSVRGLYFLQEDSPHEIGQAIARFIGDI